MDVDPRGRFGSEVGRSRATNPVRKSGEEPFEGALHGRGRLWKKTRPSGAKGDVHDAVVSVAHATRRKKDWFSAMRVKRRGKDAAES